VVWKGAVTCFLALLAWLALSIITTPLIGRYLAGRTIAIERSVVSEQHGIERTRT
jgi:hypothetical protein